MNNYENKSLPLKCGVCGGFVRFMEEGLGDEYSAEGSWRCQDCLQEFHEHQPKPIRYKFGRGK